MKNECILTSSPYICPCVLHMDRFRFFFCCSLFPISLFIKCPVVSCVQVMECSDVLVTAQEDGIFHQWTGPGSEPPAPVYRWTTTQHTGPAEMNLVTACSSVAAVIKYPEVSY